MQGTLIDDRYELGDALGGGGMAEVFLARDRLLERDIALKILKEHYAEDPEFVERFRREAQNAASLSHPNVVGIYDRGESEDGRYYIAMEHVRAGTLADRIRSDGPLAEETAAEVGAQIADALAAAHEVGLIHRDIKPGNVLVTARGDVKVADFGIARAASATASATSLSRTNVVLGTALYMSPEQALGEEVGSKSDLYSLGVVLYEALTGRVPFSAESPTAVCLMHVNEPPAAPVTVSTGISEGMNALVLKLLSKSPEDRHESAATLVEDLRRLGEGLAPLNAAAADVAGAAESVDSADGSSAQVTTELRGISPRRGMRSRRTLAGAALLAALLAVVGWSAWPSSEEPGIAGSLEGAPEQAREAVGQTVDGAGRALGAVGEALPDAIAGPFGEPEQLELPAVEGLSQEAATQQLGQAGFDAQVRPRQSSAVQDGTVLEQSVPAGQRAPEGSTILLAVGSGPDGSPVNDANRDAKPPENVAPRGASPQQSAASESASPQSASPQSASPQSASPQSASPQSAPSQGDPSQGVPAQGNPLQGGPSAGGSDGRGDYGGDSAGNAGQDGAGNDGGYDGGSNFGGGEPGASGAGQSPLPGPNTTPADDGSRDDSLGEGPANDQYIPDTGDVGIP